MDKHFAGISRNAFLLILCLTAVLSIAVLLSYVLMPAYRAFIQTTDSYLAVSAEVELARTNHPDMEQIEETISALKLKMDGEGVHMPSRQFESQVISELQHLASKNSVELGGVRPRQGQVVDHYLEVLFDVDLSGEYFDLYRFLLDLAEAPGFLVINELSISPRPSTGSTAELDVKLSIASWRQERQ